MNPFVLDLLVCERLSEFLPPHWHENAAFHQLAIMALEASQQNKLWIIRVSHQDDNDGFYFESR